jgi:hypothetical protein
MKNELKEGRYTAGAKLGLFDYKNTKLPASADGSIYYAKSIPYH